MKKNFPKIIIIAFLAVFIIQMISLIALTIIPRETRALNEEPIKFKMQVPIPGTGTFGTDSSGNKKDVEVSGLTLGNYIVDIYKYAIGIVGILASIILMYGGIVWITAFGSAERISEAQSWIKAAITGTILALSSYMILYIVNPDLVKFKTLTITDVKLVGCCIYKEGETEKSEQMKKEDCDKKTGSLWTDKTCPEEYICDSIGENTLACKSAQKYCILNGYGHKEGYYYRGSYVCGNNISESKCYPSKELYCPSGYDCSSGYDGNCTPKTSTSCIANGSTCDNGTSGASDSCSNCCSKISAAETGSHKCVECLNDGNCTGGKKCASIFKMGVKTNTCY